MKILFKKKIVSMSWVIILFVSMGILLNPAMEVSAYDGELVLEETFDDNHNGWIGSARISGESYNFSTSNSVAEIDLVGDSSWTDYEYSGDFKITQAYGSVGLVFRYVDTNNYCLYRLNRPSSGAITLELFKWANGGASGIETGISLPSGISFAINTIYNLKIKVVGSNVSLYFNDVLVHSESNIAPANGKVGLRSFGTTGTKFNSSFDNLKVKAIVDITEYLTVGLYKADGVTAIDSGDFQSGSTIVGKANCLAGGLKPGDDAVLIIGVYNNTDNNKLIQLEFQEGTVAADGTLIVEQPVILNNEVNSNCCIKAMLWQSMENMIPIIDKASFNE